MAGSTTSDIVALVRPLDPPLPVPGWPAGIARVPLRTADAEAIHDVVKRAYANGYGTVHAEWLDWWEWMVRDPEFDQKLCVVAAEGTTVVGFCLVWTSAFVKDLVVDPARQEAGIGAALLTSAMAELHARNHTRLRLKAHARNARALEFYRRMGFTAEAASPPP